MARVLTNLGKDRRCQVTLMLVAMTVALAAILIHNQTSLADLEAPQASDRRVTLAVVSLLKREHLSKHELDDEISERFFKKFIESLDPMKLYFTQDDIDTLGKQHQDLDDKIRVGDVSFAYEVYNVFLKRVDERLATINELLEGEFDFTTDEHLITDRDELSFPKNAAEAKDRWRKRLKYDMLVQKADDKTPEESVEKLKRRYSSFAKRMRQTDGEELLEMYLTAMTTSYDPHTTYMSPATLENFEISMRLQLEGIGAALQYEDGQTVVSKIIVGGAADKDSRLKPRDKIIGVAQGDSDEFVDTVDMKLGDVVKMIRGKGGTVVRLKVLPEAGLEPKIYDITRAKVELTDEEARSEIIENGVKADGSAFKLGVIDLPSFYMDMEGARRGTPNFKSTTRDVKKILADFKAKNVDAVILDLRRNGGGSLTEAINLTGLFIDHGPIVQVKDPDGKVQHYDDQDRGTSWDGPLVVLTSKFSASASEIFAGAIQDYRRGLIVGDHATHGKGTVQSLLSLGQQLFRIPNAPELGALKITMQQFYRPSGDSTQSRGVLADLELPSLTTHLDVGESDLDFAVEFDRVNPVPYRTVDMVDEAMVKSLAELSTARLQSSEDFKKVQERINRYRAQKAKKRVALNEKKFLAERKELNSEEEEEKEIENLNDPERPIVKQDFYFKETMAITVDYARMLEKLKLADTN